MTVIGLLTFAAIYMIFTRPQRSHIDLSESEVQRITDKYDNFWYITLADADLDYYW